MAKIAILGDTHFGMRNDSLAFYENNNKFYQEVFFPYIREHNITNVVQLGDLFDRRKFINFDILSRAKRDFFDKFGAWGYYDDVDKEDDPPKDQPYLYALVGNHDIYFRNTLKVNSPELILREYNECPYQVEIVTEPGTYRFHANGCEIDFIPWICAENEKQITEFIQNSKSEICFGHFELDGFEMDRGNFCRGGMNKSLLKKYEIVFSGHFHHRSSDGQILYVGTPGQMTFADVDSIKGFHVFDDETRLIEFVPNPFIMFHKFVYDDNDFTFEKLAELDLTKYAGTYVKVIVLNKNVPYLFEKFMEALTKVNPIDITIQEDSFTVASENEENIQTENTLDILKGYITDMDLEIDKDILYGKMHEMFIESQHLEQI